MLAITIVLFVVPHNQQIVTIRQLFTCRIPLFRSQNLNIQKKNSTKRILSFFTHFSNNTVNYFLITFDAYNGLASLVSLPKTNFNSSKAIITFSGISTCAI